MHGAILASPTGTKDADDNNHDDELKNKKTQNNDNLSKRPPSQITKPTLSVKLKKFNRPRSLIKDITKKTNQPSSSSLKSDKGEDTVSPKPAKSSNNSKKIISQNYLFCYTIPPSFKIKYKKAIKMIKAVPKFLDCALKLTQKRKCKMTLKMLDGPKCKRPH